MNFSSRWRLFSLKKVSFFLLKNKTPPSNFFSARHPPNLRHSVWVNWSEECITSINLIVWQGFSMEKQIWCSSCLKKLWLKIHPDPFILERNDAERQFLRRKIRGIPIRRGPWNHNDREDNCRKMCALHNYCTYKVGPLITIVINGGPPKSGVISPYTYNWFSGAHLVFTYAFLNTFPFEAEFPRNSEASHFERNLRKSISEGLRRCQGSQISSRPHTSFHPKRYRFGREIPGYFREIYID